MERLMTAREFAESKKINPRKVQRWAENEGAVEGWATKVGQAWTATPEAWETAAAKDRKTGPKPKSSSE